MRRMQSPFREDAPVVDFPPIWTEETKFVDAVEKLQQAIEGMPGAAPISVEFPPISEGEKRILEALAELRPSASPAFPPWLIYVLLVLFGLPNVALVAWVILGGMQ